MQLIPFLHTHARYRANIDAFVDGELHGAALRAFERHLASCDSCASAVAAAQTLKASLGALPQRGAPRSFALTPEMVTVTQRERPPAALGTPLYLGVARVAAVVSVVAFVSVFTLSVLGGDSESGQQSTSGASERNAAPQAADAAAGAPLAASSAESTNTYAVGSPTVLLAPATSGAVSGAGAASATPAPPSTGARQTPEAPQPNAGSVVSKAAGDDGTALGDASAIEPAAARPTDSADSDIPWTIVLGSIAGVLVGILLVAESQRRRS